MVFSLRDGRYKEQSLHIPIHWLSYLITFKCKDNILSSYLVGIRLYTDFGFTLLSVLVYP